MKSETLVSAIIPTYNRGYILHKAIDSIFNQTYKNVEVIIVDDGSTDDTQKMLMGYGDRIRVIYQQNAGPSAARNKGIEASQGEIIAFLDSDDVWLPTKLERQVSLLQRAPASVPCCLCNGVTTTDAGEKWNAFEMGLFYPDCDEGLCLNITDVLSTRFVLFCQLVAIRRSALEKVGYFDPDMRFMEDYDLALRLSAEGPWGFIREPLAYMTICPADSLSLQVSKEYVCRAQYILKTRQHLLEKLQKQNQTSRTVSYLKQEINRARRQLWGARLRESNFRGVRITGILFKSLEHYRMALFRRSPWFPRAKAIPL
jgi:glycosyltransferase involved in cell wall biosynthesis